MSASAWNVSSEPTQRNILIEEYTGVRCPNCPDGHRVATELKSLHPGRIYSVAIHAGYYASPVSGQPDYTTAIGDALFNRFEPSFFPSGIVNRTAVDGEFVQSRSSWGSVSRDIVTQTSPVNLWMESTLNCVTNELKVTVEGYIAEEMADPRLNLFLLQSEILGPQAGGLLGEEYPHRHMLRDRVTNADFGDKITAAQGEYFSKTYTYTVPEDYKGIAVEPDHLSLLCFVTEGEENVCQVIEEHPTLSHPEEFSKVEISSVLITDKNYALDYVELYVHNYGNVAVTSADFKISLNSESFTTSWTGTVEPFSTALVRLPLEGRWKDSYDVEYKEYTISMTGYNGETADVGTVTGSFREIFHYPDELTFKIKTDLNASDNTYRILDEEGNVVKEFGPYPEGEATEYTESVTLEDGKVYGLEIADQWGDGIRHPLGSVKIYDNGGRSVTQIREIDGYGLRQFFLADSSLAVEGVSAAAEVVATEMFDMAGRRVASDISAPGLYIERRQMSDGSVKILKKVANR